MQNLSLNRLTWPQFTHQYKLIKNISSQSSFYSPYSLYLNIQSKQKYLIKQISFQNTQELQIILDEIQKSNLAYNFHNRQYLCQIKGLCVKFQDKQQSQFHQTKFYNKEGKVLLLFKYFKSLKQIIQSILLSSNQQSFIQADSEIFTIKNLPYFSSIIPERTILNILKTLIQTVDFVRQFNLNFIKSFTLQMIQIQNFAQFDEKCKVLFYPFADKDITQMIWNQKYLIQDSFVGQKVLQTINRVQTNEFTRINLQNSENQMRQSFNKKSTQKENLFSTLNQEEIVQSLLQSIGLIILKMVSLSLGKQTFIEAKFYKMNLKYQLTLNFQTFQILLSQVKRNGIYSKSLIDKIQQLIFCSENGRIFNEIIQYLNLNQNQKEKSPSPINQRKTFSIGKVSIKQKKQINTNLNLTPSKKIGIQMSKLVNRSGKDLNDMLKQKKYHQNPKQKSKQHSNSRSNSIIRDKSRILASVPKPKEFSPSIVQKNPQSSSKKSFSQDNQSNKNATFSINNEGQINSERQIFIQTLKKKILYDPITGQIHENIISKEFRDGSTYLGQYNPSRNIKEGQGLYFYFDGDIYGGTWKNDQLNGLGVYYFANGDSYEGSVINGQKDGFGAYKYGNGNSYKGQWKKDKKQGQGEFFYSNGDSYIGRFVEGRKQGHGVYKWANGDEYEGNFARNMKNGNGKFKKTNTEDIIEGIWENEEFINNKKATIFYGQSEQIYQGQVQYNGIIHGQGRYQFQKESFYQGQIKNNRYDGECIIHYNNGDAYKGQIKDDLFQGQGEYYFAQKNMKYIGLWSKGKQQGPGQLLFINEGTLIETKWQNGDYGRHKAIIKYRDGSRYEGDINQNGRNGRGRYFYRDGKWIEGQFDCNKLVHLYEISQ